MITLVFRSSTDAETAFEEYFKEANELFRSMLNREDSTIQLEGWIGQLNLEIPDDRRQTAMIRQTSGTVSVGFTLRCYAKLVGWYKVSTKTI